MPHLDAAYNLARWLVRSSADADDIVQEAMLRAFRSFDSFRGGDARPWLLTIVRNCCMTALGDSRRRKNEPLPENDDARMLVSPEEDPETRTIRADHARKLAHAIAELPAEYREVLILREMEDMPYRDIAAVAGVPIGTVMSRLARARAALKDKWLNEAEGASHGVP